MSSHTHRHWKIITRALDTTLPRSVARTGVHIFIHTFEQMLRFDRSTFMSLLIRCSFPVCKLKLFTNKCSRSRLSRYIFHTLLLLIFGSRTFRIQKHSSELCSFGAEAEGSDLMMGTRLVSLQPRNSTAGPLLHPDVCTGLSALLFRLLASKTSEGLLV